MAKPPAVVDQKAEKKGPSLVVQIIVLLMLSGVAAGVGLFTGNFMTGGAAPVSAEAAGKEKGKEGEAATPEDVAAANLKRGVVAMSPIMTNLAAPANTWVRLELSAVFEGEPDLTLVDAVHQDLLAFLRTVKMHQVEGASGFLHLKEDMNERARIRTEGKVKDILIKALLFE